MLFNPSGPVATNLVSIGVFAFIWKFVISDIAILVLNFYEAVAKINSHLVVETGTLDEAAEM